MNITRRQVLSGAIAAGLLPNIAGISGVASAQVISGQRAPRVRGRSVSTGAAPNGLLRDTFQTALDDAVSRLRNSSQDENWCASENTSPLVGVVSLDSTKGDWLWAGHMPQTGGRLSNIVPYELSFTCLDSSVSSMSLKLFLLNVHFLLGDEKANTEFVPARYEQASGFEEFSKALAWGLTCYTGDATELGGAQAIDSAKTPADFLSFQDEILSRIDLQLAWKAAAPSEPVDEGTFSASVLSGGSGGSTRMFWTDAATLHESPPGTAPTIDSLLHRSERVALQMSDPASAVLPIDSETGGRAFEAWRKDFDLPKRFKGLALGKVHAYWLDDDLTVSSESPTAAFDALIGLDAPPAGGTSSWFLRGLLKFEDPSAHTVMRIFDPESLSIAIERGNLRRAAISAALSIEASGVPFITQLDGRKLDLALTRASAGTGRDGWDIDISLHGTGEEVLATLKPGDGVDQSYLDTAVLALSFVGATTAGGKPNPAAGRTGFVKVGESLLKVGAAATVESVFPDAFTTHELRIRGVYLRSQAGSITGSPLDRETAFLVDYEADYDVDLNAFGTGLRTLRPITTRINKSGFTLGDWSLDFPWVQGIDSLFSFSIGDPGFWNIEGLAGLLKMTSLGLHGPKLKFGLGLASDFGIIEASDFGLTFDLSDIKFPTLQLPSQIGVNLAGVLEGKGRLIIEDNDDNVPGTKRVSGAIDLKLLAIGLRIGAAARISKVLDNAGSPVTAFLASLIVEFPELIPLLNTGLGLKGIEGLYGENFRRVENVEAPWPTLDWFQRANGSVAESVVPLKVDGKITSDALWKESFGAWAVGLGVRLALMANEKLVNINGLVLFEIPGPSLTIFSKVTLLNDPTSNEGFSIENAVLGVVQFDGARNRLNMAASADFDLANKLIEVHSMIGLSLPTDFGSDWQFDYGRYPVAERAYGKVSLPGITLRVEFYFMAAGNGLTIANVVYPGFAIALGFTAALKIGGSSVYLKGGASVNLVANFEKNLFAALTLSASGELRLWFVSIGASAAAALYYSERAGLFLKSINASGEVRISRFFKLRGSVRYDAKSGQAPLELPDLVAEFAFARADSAILFGAAAELVEPISVKPDDPPTTPPIVPIDTVILISMRAAPLLKSDPLRVLDIAPGTNMFQYGGDTPRLSFALSDLRLEDENGVSVFAGWDRQINGPIGTWRDPSPVSVSEGNPSNVRLALLSRNPVPGSGANLDPPVDLTELCAEIVAARIGFYTFFDDQVGSRPSWSLPGTFCEAAETVASRPPTALMIAADLAGDQISRLPAGAFCLHLSPLDRSLAAARFVSGWWGVVVSDNNIEMLTRRVAAVISGDFGFGQPVYLLLAVNVPKTSPLIEVSLRFRGASVPAKVDIIDLSFGVSDLGGLEFCAEAVQLAQKIADLRTVDAFSGHNFVAVKIQARPEAEVDEIRLEAPVAGPVEKMRGMAESDLIVAGVGFIPQSELDRVANAELSREVRRRQIESMLKDGEKGSLPMLKPGTTYTLTVGTQISTQMVRFTASEKPPEKLEPYLLATFPSNNQKHHYFSDAPAICLESDLILRVLSEYKDADVTVVVSEDRGEPVIGNHDPLKRWDLGISYSPTELLRMAKTGLRAGPLSSSEDALRNAADGCVPIPTPTERSMWIHFDIRLDPRRRYTVKLILRRELFYAWSFETSTFESAEKHEEAINGSSRYRRMLAGTSFAADGKTWPTFLAIPGLSVPADVQLIPDKIFQDSVRDLMGERTLAVESYRTTTLFDKSARPAWTLVEAVEPLVRFIELPNPSLPPSKRIASIACAYSLPVGTPAGRMLISTDGCRALIASSDANATVRLTSVDPTLSA